MGNSLMSNDEKLAYQSVINDLAKTFERPIVIYRTPEKVILATNPNYNFAYSDNQPNNEVSSYTVNSGTFNARISSLSTEEANKLLFMSASRENDVSAETRLAQVKNIVKIKLEQDGYEFMKGAEFIDLDEDRYVIISSARKHGLFFPEYYTYYLQRTD